MNEITIFKLDSKSKLRFLTISTVGNKIIQESGIVGSANPVTNISECVAKNIGKANATTAEEQAVIEAKAKIKKKLEEGYYETPEEAQGGDLVLPMLAKDFNKEERKVVYPCFAQPKLDGMRALKSNTSLVSRKAKAIDTMDHISNGIENVPHHTLDGELYAHGESFQRNMELIKKYRPGESETVKYHVYDIIYPGLSFKQRYILLKEFLAEYKPENIELVETREIKNKEELLDYHTENLALGYEGTMVRWGEEEYQMNKRSSHLLKLKDFKDLACRIRAIKPSEKRSEQGSFECEMAVKKWVLRSPSGIIVDIREEEFKGAVYDYPTFGCGMRFSHDERKDVVDNPQDYIGKTAEIRFFEYTDLGLPRFPVCVGLRLDK